MSLIPVLIDRRVGLRAAGHPGLHMENPSMNKNNLKKIFQFS